MNSSFYKMHIVTFLHINVEKSKTINYKGYEIK
jgi:hypothetical protein